MITGYKGFLNPALAVAIAMGAQESAVIATGGFELCGVFIPAAFTGVAITFEAAPTVGGTYVPVVNAAGPVSYAVAPGQYIAIDPKDFQGISFLKIKSGSAEGAARTLVCALRG